MTNLELKTIIENGNLDLGDARKLYEMIEMENTLSKYNFPTKPSSDGYYHIYVKDPTVAKGRRQLKAKDLDALKQKVYEYEKYNSVSTRKTFADGFSIVQQRKPKYIKDPEKLLSVRNTIHRDQVEYNRFFKGTDFEQKYLDEITEKDIENICYSNLKRYDVHYKGFLYMRSILKSVFTMAYQERIIDENIYSRANFNKFKHMLVSSAPIETRVHEANEVDAMLEYTHEKQTRQPYLVSPFAFELQVLMGLRVGEVTALKWADIKSEGYVLIHASQVISRDAEKGSKHLTVVNHTKTWKDRKYPVTSEVQEFLDKWKPLHDKYHTGSEYLFPKRKTIKEPLHNQSINIYYQTMCKNLGIELSSNKKKGPHSFRRNAITKVVNNSGGDILMASKLFGNTPQIADNNYYVGLDLNLARSVIENGNQMVTKNPH